MYLALVQRGCFGFLPLSKGEALVRRVSSSSNFVTTWLIIVVDKIAGAHSSVGPHNIPVAITPTSVELAYSDSMLYLTGGVIQLTSPFKMLITIIAVAS